MTGGRPTLSVAVALLTEPYGLEARTLYRPALLTCALEITSVLLVAFARILPLISH